jgi:hexosaminidase
MDMAPELLPCTPAKRPVLANVIPLPASIQETGGAYCLPSNAVIEIEPASAELAAIGQYLAERLRPATGYSLPVHAASGAPAPGSLRLILANADPGLGDEGYELTIQEVGVTLRALRPAGVFRGVQTLRQLWPPAIELGAAQPGPWSLATGVIRDYPRFSWRGVMLDVARHFFSVADLKRYIDIIAYYKINRFHLHLSDDQGWRIAIDAWPSLATIGGSTQVGGASGSLFYTQAQYAELVAHALQRYIVIVPEIDMPGHTNAALASYASLNCNGVAPPLYTGTNVGFSSLCIGNPTTAMFVEDVIGEVAGLTHGPYLHIGGDEASATAPSDYVQFIQNAQTVVEVAGKQMIGWADIAQAPLSGPTIAQHWNPFDTRSVQKAVLKGLKVIMSPANHCYLDMKYDSSTTLGINWAGCVDEQQAYAWDPASEVAGVGEANLVGVEAALWTETVVTPADVDYMTFPRLAGHAEIGWSPASGRHWDEYKTRLAAHGPRLTAMGVQFYKSPRIPWP